MVARRRLAHSIHHKDYKKLVSKVKLPENSKVKDKAKNHIQTCSLFNCVV